MLSGREMADMAIEKGAIDMAQGVAHTPPPQIFLEILTKNFAKRRWHIYASPAGYKGYRQALLKILHDERPELSLESVMATNGVTGGLISALRSHCQPQDHVVLLEPFYPAHDWAIQSLHLVTEYVPYAPDFTIDFAAIETALSKASAFVLANPANPTGTVLNQADLKRLHTLCQKHDVLLIIDEVYKDFIWEGKYSSLLSIVDNLENLVILRSFSKNLALAGWRTGFAITTPERISAMTHVHDVLYIGAPSAPQFILADILTNHRSEMDAFVKNTVELYRDNREKVITAFTNYDMKPKPKEGAYYMMVKHNRDADEAAMKELLNEGIAVAPGVPFYRPGTKDTGYIRIHFALSPADMKEVVTIIGK